MKRLILMMDGSPAAAAAARWCVDNAGTNTEVIAVTAFSAIGELVLGLPPSRSVDWIHQVREALEGEWSRPLRDAGVPVRCEVLEAAPVRALIDIADREDAAAIVVGKRARGFLSEHVLGSVAADLVHHSHRPVIVVPCE
jgi:nucleotide-binding universal stress UspA family protein